MPKISVIMSVYNETLNELKQSILSILYQTFKNFELIIVDDNPKSLAIKELLQTYCKRYVNVHLLINNTNLGPALSRNEGVLRSKGTFIAIMDADDISKKDRLFSELRFMKKYNLDFVFPNYELISENNKILNKKIYKFNSILDYRVIKYIFSNINDISINSGWLLKKDIFTELNGYRNVIDEDYDFIARAIIKKYNIGYLSVVLISKRFRHNSIMRRDSLLIYLMSKFIKGSLKKDHIFSIKKFNLFIKNNLSHEMEYKFNKFIFLCHNIRHHFNMINVIKVIYSILFVKFAFSFIVDKLFISERIKQLVDFDFV